MSIRELIRRYRGRVHVLGEVERLERALMSAGEVMVCNSDMLNGDITNSTVVVVVPSAKHLRMVFSGRVVTNNSIIAIGTHIELHSMLGRHVEDVTIEG